jgi:hypothetical protein
VKGVGNKMEKDIFGFEKAIELDHLTNDELELLAEMFFDYK